MHCRHIEWKQLRDLVKVCFFKLNCTTFLIVWSEPSNDGSRPESVVLSLVTVQAHRWSQVPAEVDQLSAVSSGLCLVVVVPARVDRCGKCDAREEICCCCFPCVTRDGAGFQR